jgi:hypothetical protein
MTMSKMAVALGVALSVGLSVAGARAQEVAKPVRAVGDWCDYQVQGTPSGKERNEVIAVAPDGGYTIQRSGLREETRVFNANSELTSVNARHYTRGVDTPRFPISAASVGQTSTFSVPHLTRPGVTVDFKRTIRSVRAERVTVPAGTFDTLRIEFVASYRRSDGYANEQREIVWYGLDPALRSFVKQEFQDYGTNNSYAVRSMIGCGSKG